MHLCCLSLEMKAIMAKLANLQCSYNKSEKSGSALSFSKLDLNQVNKSADLLRDTVWVMQTTKKKPQTQNLKIGNKEEKKLTNHIRKRNATQSYCGRWCLEMFLTKLQSCIFHSF